MPREDWLAHLGTQPLGKDKWYPEDAAEHWGVQSTGCAERWGWLYGSQTGLGMGGDRVGGEGGHADHRAYLRVFVLFCETRYQVAQANLKLPL